MVTCTNRSRTVTASAAGYTTPEMWMRAWLFTTVSLAVAMFLAWSVGSAVAAAFFGTSAEGLRYLLCVCGFAWAGSLLINIAVDWFCVRAARGRLRIVQDATGRVVVVAPHQLADALGPWYADAARPVVIADRLSRLQASYMAGETDPHIEAVMGLSINPVVRKSA